MSLSCWPTLASWRRVAWSSSSYPTSLSSRRCCGSARPRAGGVPSPPAPRTSQWYCCTTCHLSASTCSLAPGGQELGPPLSSTQSSLPCSTLSSTLCGTRRSSGLCKDFWVEARKSLQQAARPPDLCRDSSWACQENNYPHSKMRRENRSRGHQRNGASTWP